MTVTETRTEEVASAIDIAKVQSFAEHVSGDQAVGYNTVLAYLGDRLGLWRSLASVPSVTSAEFAERTGLAERYLREWLSAQAAAGYLVYDPGTGRFELPAEHAMVLADDDSPTSLAGGFQLAAALWASVDTFAHAFATGEGVRWSDQDPRVTTAVERNFRPLYRNSLIDEWLPAVDGLTDRLNAGIRVLDVGCGLGTPTVMMAEAFPQSTYTGIDNDVDSIRRASGTVARDGLAGRVEFEVATLDQHRGGPYDAVFFFDALHDMGDPVGVLRRVGELLADDGVVIAVEPAAADELENNLHPLGLLWYASSALVCVPGSLSQPGGAALGAQAGPKRLLEVFTAAGFAAEVVATTPFNLVIEARR